MSGGSMTNEGQDTLRRWFERYIGLFRDREGFLHPMLELKLCHSLRVAKNAGFIAAALNFPEAEKLLAEDLGLVHDVGRFTQFAQYGSFRDADTMDASSWRTTISRPEPTSKTAARGPSCS